MIPPWFQACIYWKMSVMWRHHFQPSIFSIIESLFDGSPWSDPYVKETMFISQHLLQPSLQQAVCRWFKKIWKVYLFEENNYGPALLKVPLYSTEQVAVIFVWKLLFKCTKALAAIPFFHGECVNLTISQQQLQLFIKYSKYFRRTIVDICTYKGYFRNIFFL